MKKIFLLQLLCFLLVAKTLTGQEDFRKTSPKPGPAPRIELGKAVQFTLKNGLKVIVAENHKLPRVSFQIFVDVPPLMESESTGYASVAGQLLNKGTATRSKSQIDEATDFIGASLNTSASGVSGECLTKHKDKLLTLMADVLFNPTFPEDEFQKIKKQTLASLAQSKDDPNTIASNVARVLRNGKNHPYGELTTEQSVEKITVDQCKSFYQTFFKPNISYLIVTGDISGKEARTLANKYFGKWAQGTVSKQDYPAPQKPAEASVAFVDKANAVQSVINITYPVDLKPGSPDAIKASVMNTLLGGYFSSRLNANLREDKAYTYGARSGLSTDPVIGSFSANASVRNAVTDSSIIQFLYEMNNLRTGEISDSELDMVKNVMTGNFARSLEDPGTVASFSLNTARYNLPADYYSTYLKRLGEVTKKDITEMANKYITPSSAHILVVGNKDEVSQKLSPFSSEKTIRYYDYYGNPIEQAGLVIPSGVTAETVLSDYLAALGSPEKLKAVNSVKIVMSTSLQGMTIETVLSHKAPGKLSMVNTMMGNVMQQMIFDGQKGVQISRGQTSVMEGSDLEDKKVDANLFPERKYKELGVKTELKGLEMVNGKKAFKIQVEYPSGTKKTHYFDVESSLKIREIETEGGVTITNDIGNYKEVDGVKFPHSITISGAAPFPIKMETQSVEVNVPLSDDIFKVE